MKLNKKQVIELIKNNKFFKDKIEGKDYTVSKIKSNDEWCITYNDRIKRTVVLSHSAEGYKHLEVSGTVYGYYMKNSLDDILYEITPNDRGFCFLDTMTNKWEENKLV